MKTLDTIKNKPIPITFSWMKAAVTGLLLLMLTSLSIRNVTAQEVFVPESDSLALVAFYNSMSGDHWIENGGWLVDRVDTWFGIETDNIGTEQNPEWRVVEIELEDNMTLPGSIPPEIGDLEYLEDLVLRGDPALFGEWPKEVENLVNIDEIRTQGTNMSGEIPWQEFANTGSITRIRIQNAEHFGVMPDQIFAEMPQLERLQINDMYISGNLPSSINGLENLRVFRIMGNLLTGEIPYLGDLIDVEQFHINGQDFEPGPIPSWIANWGETLEELDIQNTNRTGTVPNWLSTDMFALEQLTVGEVTWDLENAIGGQFPDMSSLLDFQNVHIYGPHWEGSLPSWIGSANMERVELVNCSFTGDIPSDYANINDFLIIENCPEVTGGLPDQFATYTGESLVLDMSDSWNDRYEKFGNEEAVEYYSNPQMEIGDIPTYIGDWSAEEITLRNVGVTGTIPDEIANIGTLQTLDLAQNPDLTGNLPAGFFNNISLTSLNLSQTGINISEVPSDLNNHTLTLNNLGLAGLGITGDIPAWLGDFSQLQSLDLSDNNLTGSIPSEISNLQLLSSLNLANNQLSGELPINFEDIGFLGGFYTLNSLDLSGNEELTGELPLRFSDAELMLVMRYNDTDLRAPDNPAFSNWLENVIPSNDVNVSFPPLYVDVQTSGLIGTSLDDEYSDNPYTFQLGTNYPNPFNPTTTFSYQIPETGHVKLNIYNVLGQEVATLVNEIKSAGSYEINFDASSLSSGAYLYRLKSGDKVMTQRMMLIK